VAGVTVDSPGSGYLPDDEVIFTVTDGGDWFSEAWATLTLNRLEPTLGVDVSTSGGSGAQFSVSLEAAADFDGNDVWAVDSVTVDDGGSGYSIGDTASIDFTGAIEASPASLALELVRSEPAVAATAISFGEGEGAELAVTLNQTTDFNGKTAWEVSSVSVTNGGSGYESFDYVVFSATSGIEISAGSATVTVGEDGEILSVTIGFGGLYHDTTGEIESVEVLNGGQYYETDGAIESIAVLDGGIYYKDQPTGNIIVDTPTVSIYSNIGVGATATATVDDDPDSPTFGQVTSVTITNGGTGYRLTGVYRKIVVLFGLGDSSLSGSLAAAYTEPSTILCYGEELAPYIPAPGTIASQTACGDELLDATYPVILSGFGAPFGFTSIPEGAVYSSRDLFGICGDLRILDTGSGQITCTIAPA
jgi:hypothetical protein